MWSAITKVFTKISSNIKDHSGVEEVTEMEQGDHRRRDMDETFTSKQGKQRATVKWLLSKAFNNKVPENLKEPFYRDHDNQEHLKPQIAGALANAEIYCLALGNIYSDPNYHNLNHWAILQTLARKGVYINEPTDGSQMTETTLIQTNPLRMSAHMAVIESIMSLYAKEVVTGDRVLAAVQRFCNGRNPAPSIPENHEQGLILWVSHACAALKSKIDQELKGSVQNGAQGDSVKPPNLPPIRELKDFSDGVGLAALISYYCPDELPWTELRISYMPTVQESLHNLNLLQDFCDRCLPSSIFHVNPEDVTYMRESMKPNIIVFLADLFNVMEIHPANCVRYPGMERFSNASRSTPTHVPLKKNNSLQQVPSMSEMSEDSLRRGSEDSFVVHRGKNIPTLRTIINDEPLVPARLKVNKEKQNNDSKADERGEYTIFGGKETPAGRPSNWEDTRKNTYAGRRSRRNSTSDDSQLTIENFGGSQDNLNFIGRNPDKEVGGHVGRKISAPGLPIENLAVRSSLQDARGSIQLGYDNGCEKKDDGTEKCVLKRQLSNDDLALRKSIASNNSDKENLLRDLVDGEITTAGKISFAEMTKQKMADQQAVQTVYMQHDKEEFPIAKLASKGNSNGTEKKTTFAALPNTTTWQQQSNHQQHGESNGGGGGDENGVSSNMTPQLNDIRLKLEEKRRHIESEKRRMEMAFSKQRQKVGKAAFFQAVNKEVNDGVSLVERKWLDNDQPFIEVRKTPDLENMDLEQYQHSIAQMNSSLHDIHSDIQRLASQQTQMQAAQQQNLIAQQQKQIQALQHYQNIPHPQYTPQPAYNLQMYQAPSQVYPPPLQTSSSVPHIPQAMFTQQPQFFLHDHSHHQQTPQASPPIVPQRRTWATQAQPPPTLASDSYQQPELRTWGKPANPAGFVLHDTPDRYQDSVRYENPRYQNGDGNGIHHSNSFTLSQQHHHQQQNQSFGTSHSTPSASPQHRNVHRQISQLLDDSKRAPVSLQQMDMSPPQRKSSVTHAPIPAPSADDMEPQNISFIGNADDQLIEGISRLNITSGTRTYRVPSPTRHAHPIARTSFQPSPPSARESPATVAFADISSSEKDASANQKGFYISFDDEQPKRPKPPLRAKRGSPKKEGSFVEAEEGGYFSRKQEQERLERKKQVERELTEEKLRKDEDEQRRQQAIIQERERLRAKRDASQERQKIQAASAIIIGSELDNPDPDLLDEREKKKEKIMLLSLQRRQQQEDAKARKEQEAQMRRDQDKAKEDEKARKKEEQAARRAVILEQYKMKKLIEEAEREGKVVDRSDLMGSLKPTPKMRPKPANRPRPKTIHIDSGSVEMAGGMLQHSRGKKGSTSNLTANSFTPSTMKRDYYKGSHDSLADRSMNSGLLYRDSPDDSRGMSPCHSANQTLGRRSSYKTSRDPSPAQVRGRSKFSTCQNFKGRKSSSLMNLYGSSTDQDSFAYRYGDTDSGLGRATPPRRAPSPGMGSMRHLPSPSGPGSLPGCMSKGRRMFDDGSSDISSTPSSMMDYTGPRLYKQPATKSNRGIMLNAVEYCVFPGVVNREAKRRVLEEINRSESKHFLILFRDAGCQFRALYSYCPDGEEITKLYGTGPKQVNDRMFDKFFKYNSGGKCFSQVHTKHLTVTIDAFTIHNSLWQGKKVNLPNKKDMALVI